MRNNSGLTLIELLVTIAVITISLAGIVAIFPLIIQKNAEVQIQNRLVHEAESELERLKGLSYFDEELSGLGSVEGMVTLKENGIFLIRSTVKYLDSKTKSVPKKYPVDIDEDTGIKEVTVSVKRKDNLGKQIDLISYISKARTGKG